MRDRFSLRVSVGTLGNNASEPPKSCKSSDNKAFDICIFTI